MNMRKQCSANQRVFEASSLAKIGKEALSSIEIDSILKRIVQRSFELFDADTAALFMRFGDETELVLVDAIGLYSDELKNETIKIGEGLLGSVAASGIAEIINEPFRDPRAIQIEGTPLSDDGEKILVSPLVAYDHIIGVLALWRNGDKKKFGQPELGMLEEFAAQAVIAVENARLYSEAQQRITRLSILTEIGRTLTGAIDLNELLDAVLAQIGRIFDTTNFFIVLYREGDREWEQRLNIEHGKRLPTEYYPLSKGVTGYILRNRIPVLLSSRAAWEDLLAQDGMEQLGETPHSWMGVPLIAGDKIYGVMVVQNYESENLYTQQDLELFSLVGTQVAIATQNARLYDDAKRRADEMSALVDCGTEVTASLNLQTVLERIAVKAHAMLSKDATAVYLVDVKNNSLRAVAAVGVGSDELLSRDASSGEGVLRSVAVSGIAKIGTDDTRLGTAGRTEERLMAMPMADHGQVIGILAVWRSLTERGFDGFDIAFSAGLARQATVAISNARAFERAQVAQAEAETANLLKSQFLANMSHELRTPLNAIINFTYLIKIGGEGTVNPGQLDMLERVEVAGRHLLDLVNDVLDLAKIEAGKLELLFEDVNFPELCGAICSTIQSSLLDKPIELLNAVPDAFPSIRADKMRLRQVLFNLLSNAVKFTERGQIRIDAEYSDTNVTISVSDTGIGIAAGDLPKIFRDFVQVDGDLSRKTGGSGLGLSISRHFVELHGGTISVTSEVGRGSRFCFNIPRGLPVRQ